MEQWVKKVKKFSSQYNDQGWEADCLIGEPKVYPHYGDMIGAWATEEIDANQFAEVKFETSVYVTGIEIYETFHAGGVRRVAALNNKQWVTLWETEQVTDIDQARIFSPPLKPTDFTTKDIRIEIDCTVAGTWVEIDAIKLIRQTDKPANGSSIIEQQPQYPPNCLEQWVDKVKKFSSQYDNDLWKADCLIGAPKVYPNYGDIAGAWATEYADDNQFAEVKFKTSVYVAGIEIYETFHAGGVKRIAALKNKQWMTLWETEKVKDIGQARIFSPPLKPTDFPTKDIRIEIDCTVAGTWVEIDAIKLIGQTGPGGVDEGDARSTAMQDVPAPSTYIDPGFEQWVHKVKNFSSQYDDHAWCAEYLKGEPRRYPNYGDLPETWAMGTIDAHQFAEVAFKKSVQVQGIEIYETYHAGGVKRIAACNKQKRWVTLWETPKVTDIKQSRIFSPPLRSTNFKTKNIRIEIDCTAAGTWVEIDAIKLLGKPDNGYSSDSSDSDEEKEVKKKKKPQQKSSSCTLL